MMNSPFPENFEQWRHCITVECGIPLTMEYVQQRLAIWRNQELEETSPFRRLYGDPHWRAVTVWFEQAERQLAGGHAG